ncbi:MAG: hypothetical protein J6F33_14275, partial [Acidaminococcaceae bacterium]|nr:hypothetical protein [Acidaminococcaceae bacterium]
KKSLNSFGNYFSAKCVSVLLTVFVFVAGMMVSNVAIAAPAVKNVNPTAGVGKIVDSLAETVKRVAESYRRVKTFDDNVIIEGTPNLKSGKTAKNQYGIITQQSFSAEVVKGKVMKLHYLFKPISLGELDKQRNNKYKELGGKPTGKQHFIKRDATITMQLTAKNGDKVIKGVKKSYKNQTDCILDYQVPENVTAITVKINVTDVVEEKDPSKNNHGWWGHSENKRVITVALKPVKKLAAPVASTEKTGSDSDAGGIGVGEIGAVIAIGGAGIWFAYTQLGGGGSEAAEGTEEDTAAGTPPPAPKEYIYTDPSGFQTLYVQDPETGQWTNYETGNPVDMDSLQEYDKQRLKDMEWSHNETQNLADRNSAFDNDLKQDYRNMLEEEARLQQQTKKDMMAIKTGTYGMTDAERQVYLEERQAKLVADKEAADQKAKVMDTMVKTAEVVQKGADLGVSILSVVTAPVGGTLIADVYTGVKNVAGSTMEAAVDRKKSIVGGFFKGVANAGAEIVQNHAGGKWTAKLAKYAGSEALKEGFVAAIEGENVVKKTFKGVVQGTLKFGVDKIGNTISGGVGQQNLNLNKQKYWKIKNVWSKDLKPKTVNALQHMNFQRYFAKEQTRQLVQGVGQTVVNENNKTIYEMGVEGKSFTESTFGDKW